MTDVPRPAHQHGTCLNCETVLRGPFRHICGQHTLHAPRSLPELGAEILEMLTRADGKFARTMRRLAFSPGHLTRDYVAGRRASEIPPVRLFFVALLIVFTLSSFVSSTTFESSINASMTAVRQNAAAHDAIMRKIDGFVWDGHPRATAWVRTHVAGAIGDPREVEHVMGEWAERLALLLPPITACVLWLLYAVPRPVPLFDHAIFALHSLTFAILALTALILVKTILPDGIGGIAEFGFLTALVVHLFAHMRGFYRGGVTTTALRMGLLATVTFVVCLGLVTALTLIGLQFGVE